MKTELGLSSLEKRKLQGDPAAFLYLQVLGTYKDLERDFFHGHGRTGQGGMTLNLRMDPISHRENLCLATELGEMQLVQYMEFMIAVIFNDCSACLKMLTKSIVRFPLKFSDSDMPFLFVLGKYGGYIDHTN
ncbi:hypothetical protein HGM15179_008558 [Zosterops borbonicus]|uniref:Uncharacterized protein n=1 Tax=Zosterops borbonicus TaxID=364589 RepID=A0A8K1GGQ4_9PASS|nr:hypothetical protein HGM15179_008558 [Zosterops borbonicus]